MTFQCSDLERAMSAAELMAEAQAHAKACAQCREELELWERISRVAPELHEEWESPFLWTRVRAGLAASPSRKRLLWGSALASAALVLLAAALFLLGLSWHPSSKPDTDDFLTAEALRDVEQAEAAYLRSIERLSAIARATLEESSSPLAATYREKLLLLDSAIADIKSNVEGNEYNMYLQSHLASLYRDKQETLEEWLENAKKN